MVTTMRMIVMMMLLVVVVVMMMMMVVVMMICNISSVPQTRAIGSYLEPDKSSSCSHILPLFP
jgi:hypothetical protein